MKLSFSSYTDSGDYNAKRFKYKVKIFSFLSEFFKAFSHIGNYILNQAKMHKCINK